MKKHSLIVHEQLMMFMKIWKIIIQHKKRTVLIKFDNVIAYTEPKKKKVLLLLN